jgi:ABC-type transport system involved in cytochrome bd biosynthesis fused ATPase/permease subunit
LEGADRIGTGLILQHDGLEFEEEETLARYKKFKTTLKISSLLSIVTVLPSMLLFFSSYFLSSSPSYIYLIPLAIGGAFTALSIRANSKLTEIINSDEVRHI